MMNCQKIILKAFLEIILKAFSCLRLPPSAFLQNSAFIYRTERQAAVEIFAIIFIPGRGAIGGQWAVMRFLKQKCAAAICR
jgi:hypothetical protein